MSASSKPTRHSARWAEIAAAFRAAAQAWVDAVTALFKRAEVRRAITVAGDAQRQRADIAQVRRLGQVEKQRALQHLDRHVDGIYADLGLERPAGRAVRS